MAATHFAAKSSAINSRRKKYALMKGCAQAGQRAGLSVNKGPAWYLPSTTSVSLLLQVQKESRTCRLATMRLGAPKLETHTHTPSCAAAPPLPTRIKFSPTEGAHRWHQASGTPALCQRDHHQVFDHGGKKPNPITSAPAQPNYLRTLTPPAASPPAWG